MLPSIFGRNLFDDFMDFPFSTTHYNPDLMKTDIRETKDGYELDIDLPGIEKKDISLNLKDGYLTIQANHNQEQEEKDQQGQYLRRERFPGRCGRRLSEGDTVQEKDVHAKFEGGILKLSFPKEEPKQLSGGNNIAIE